MNFESEETRLKILEENQKVQNFLKQWQIENPYRNNRDEHNAKFKIDFDLFLYNSNFSEGTIKLFKD